MHNAQKLFKLRTPQCFLWSRHIWHVSTWLCLLWLIYVGINNRVFPIFGFEFEIIRHISWKLIDNGVYKPKIVMFLHKNELPLDNKFFTRSRFNNLRRGYMNFFGYKLEVQIIFIYPCIVRSIFYTCVITSMYEGIGSRGFFSSPFCF